MERDEFVLRLLQDLPEGLAKQAVMVVGLLPNHHAQSAAARSVMVAHETSGEEAVMELLLRLATGEIIRHRNQHVIMERRRYGDTR